MNLNGIKSILKTNLYSNYYLNFSSAKILRKVIDISKIDLELDFFQKSCFFDFNQFKNKYKYVCLVVGG